MTSEKHFNMEEKNWFRHYKQSNTNFCLKSRSITGLKTSKKVKKIKNKSLFPAPSIQENCLVWTSIIFLKVKHQRQGLTDSRDIKGFWRAGWGPAQPDTSFCLPLEDSHKEAAGPVSHNINKAWFFMGSSLIPNYKSWFKLLQWLEYLWSLFSFFFKWTYFHATLFYFD